MCSYSMYRYPALEEPEPSPETPTDENEKLDPSQNATEDDDSDSRVIVVDAPSQSPTELYAAAARALAEAQNAFSAAISAPQTNLISKEEAAAQTKALEGDILTLKALLRQQQLRAEMLEDALDDLKHENDALRRELGVGRGKVEELRDENERLAGERDGLRDTLVRLRTGMDGLGESSYERERGLRDRDKIGEEQQALIKKFVENVTVLQKRYEDAQKEVMVSEPKVIDSFNYMDHLLSGSRLSRESITQEPAMKTQFRQLTTRLDDEVIQQNSLHRKEQLHLRHSNTRRRRSSLVTLFMIAGEDAFSMTQDQDTYSVRAAKRPKSVNPYSEYYSTRSTASPVASSYGPLPEDFTLPPKTPPPPNDSGSSIAPQRASASASAPAPAKRIRTSDPPTQMQRQHPVASTSTSTPRLPTSSAKPRIPSGMRAFGYTENESGDLFYSGGGRNLKRKKAPG
ncbi:hypothetical protein R3P38DRAFT_2804483 [Favolaschia claudopus]|uniref:PPC89 centrosome localisation domain-containing protein n=1 Tax=Favolaschia claudopus TaxID=2862362 RepID=A0AAV9ZQD3_9AGAR